MQKATIVLTVVFTVAFAVACAWQLTLPADPFELNALSTDPSTPVAVLVNADAKHMAATWVRPQFGRSCVHLAAGSTEPVRAESVIAATLFRPDEDSILAIDCCRNLAALYLVDATLRDGNWPNSLNNLRRLWISGGSIQQASLSDFVGRQQCLEAFHADNYNFEDGASIRAISNFSCLENLSLTKVSAGNNDHFNDDLTASIPKMTKLKVLTICNGDEWTGASRLSLTIWRISVPFHSWLCWWIRSWSD